MNGSLDVSSRTLNLLSGVFLASLGNSRRGQFMNVYLLFSVELGRGRFSWSEPS